MPLKKKKSAPDFALPNQDNKMVALSDFKDSKLVIYFYPADDTPTCTTEACNLRDNYNLLLKQGYSILGVSPDTVAKHAKFIKKFNLPFDLLSDTDLAMIKSYKVWGNKVLFGRKYKGVLRTTYIIENGIIKDVIEKVIAKDHTTQIVEKG